MIFSYSEMLAKLISKGVQGEHNILFSYFYILNYRKLFRNYEKIFSWQQNYTCLKLHIYLSELSALVGSHSTSFSRSCSVYIRIFVVVFSH